MAKPIIMFSWGYHGWGPHTKELLRVSAAVEKARGYKPPLFVDIRLRRSGRAEGFKGPAFESLARSRYLWMPNLGNESIKTKQNSQIIRRPEAASDLLDIAIERAKRRQRVIFFCSCELPCECHRTKVKGLLLREARRRGVNVDIPEWPGTGPITEPVPVKLAPKVFKLLQRKSVGVYLPRSAPIERLAALPIGTVIQASCGGESQRFAVSCAQPDGKAWCLPILWEDKAPVAPTLKNINKWLKECGYEARRT